MSAHGPKRTSARRLPWTAFDATRTLRGIRAPYEYRRFKNVTRPLIALRWLIFRLRGAVSRLPQRDTAIQTGLAHPRALDDSISEPKAQARIAKKANRDKVK